MHTSIDQERYELLMIDYQITEIARLDAVLRDNGVADTGLRKRICSQFAASNGWFLDQGWLEGGAAGRFWPELAFSTRPQDPEAGLGDISELVLPEYASSFHEYVPGAIEYYFDEHHETLGNIRTGNS